MRSVDVWIKQLNEINGQVIEDFKDISLSEINARNDASSWSIGQQFDHLITINTSYFSVIKSIRNGDYNMPWHGRIAGIVNCTGNAILKSVKPENEKKSKTLPIWEPSKGEISESIINRFLKHQEKLRKMISESKELVERRVVIPSPGNGFILYYIDTAFDIIVTHERRHISAANAQLSALRE